jgi:hypothetical protein
MTYSEDHYEVYEKGYEKGVDDFVENLKNCFCVSEHYLDIMNFIDNIARKTKERV